ncbi:MAG: hypothetical protein HOF23_04680 [Rhodospirillaceae bacterium]|jgi:hypothetical protein|nr:hypothetical protein [Rhodospirillaceae bacterium]
MNAAISTQYPACFKSPKLLQVLAVIALIFGIASIFSGGQVLFGSDSARIAVGDYIPFVVWSNFIAGFAYIVAAFGLLRRTRWGAHLALAITIGTLIVFAALGIAIISGEAFEIRTIGAMILRAGLWLALTAAARQNLLLPFSADKNNV